MEVSKKSVANNYKFLVILIVCVIAGAVLGLVAPEIAGKIKPVGTIFINLLLNFPSINH